MIDYWVPVKRLQNTRANTETHAGTNLTTDHLPMIATFRIKLAKLSVPKKAGKIKVEKCNEEQKMKYNTETAEANTSIKEAMEIAAANTIPTKETTMRKDDMSEESLKLINERGKLIKQDKLQEASQITKAIIKKQRKKTRSKQQQKH